MSIIKNKATAQKPLKIAHALGRIDQVNYTNSEPAFRHSIESGFIFLETDLALTKDEKIVLYHHCKPTIESEIPWREKKAYEVSWPELSERKYLDKYPILTLEKFTSLLSENPDLFIVLDIKSRNKKKVWIKRNSDEINIFNHILLKYYKKKKKEQGAIGKAVLSIFSWTDSNKVHPHRKIIERLVEICNKSMLDQLIPQVDRFSCNIVKETYDFPSKIWKPSGESLLQAFTHAENNNCPYISLHHEEINETILGMGQKSGIKILIYGVDQEETVDHLTLLGVDGFFLDSFNLP